MLERIDSLAAAIEENQRLSNNGPVFETPSYEELYGEVKGEFLPDMTESEVLDYERKERLGWKEFKLPWQKNDTTN